MDRLSGVDGWLDQARQKPAAFKGRISPFLFLKDKLFELYGIFTVAFIKYKKY